MSTREPRNSDRRGWKDEFRRRRREEDSGMNGCLAERAGAPAFIEGRFAGMRRLEREFRAGYGRERVKMGLRDEGLQRKGEQEDKRHSAPAGASATSAHRIFRLDPHQSIIERRDEL